MGMGSRAASYHHLYQAVSRGIQDFSGLKTSVLFHLPPKFWPLCGKIALKFELAVSLLTI